MNLASLDEIKIDGKWHRVGQHVSFATDEDARGFIASAHEEDRSFTISTLPFAPSRTVVSRVWVL